MRLNKMIVVISLVIVFVLCFTVVALAAEYSMRYGDNTLRRSSTVKTVVKNVQADLSANTTYALTHDGMFGTNTYYATLEFQRKYDDLDVDGEVGKNTKTKLYPLRDSNYSY